MLMTTSLVPHYISQHIAISCVRAIARECVLYAEHSTRGGVQSLSHKRYHKEEGMRDGKVTRLAKCFLVKC